jgi:hypothetical protein
MKLFWRLQFFLHDSLLIQLILSDAARLILVDKIVLIQLRQHFESLLDKVVSEECQKNQLILLNEPLLNKLTPPHETLQSQLICQDETVHSKLIRNDETMAYNV